MFYNDTKMIRLDFNIRGYFAKLEIRSYTKNTVVFIATRS